MGGGYEQVGSASDISNVNPYTGQMMAGLGAQGAGFQNSLQGLSPNAVIANMLGQVPAFQSIIGGMTGGYGNLLNNQAMIQAQQNARQVGAQYASDTAVNSGAYESAVARGVAEPFAQAATALGGMQANLGSSLMSQYTGMAGQQAGIFGNLLGQNMGIQGQYGMPEWYEPTYAYQPGFMDYAAPIIGTVAGAAIGGPFGAALGGGLGGLFGGGGGGGGNPYLYGTGANNPYGASPSGYGIV